MDKMIDEGWVKHKKAKATKFHYYVGNRSLCCKWATLDPLISDEIFTKPMDDRFCKTCLSKLISRRLEMVDELRRDVDLVIVNTMSNVNLLKKILERLKEFEKIITEYEKK